MILEAVFLMAFQVGLEPGTGDAKRRSHAYKPDLRGAVHRISRPLQDEVMISHAKTLIWF